MILNFGTFAIGNEKKNQMEDILHYIKANGGLVRYQDFKDQGFQPRKIRELLDSGKIEKLKSGLYTLPDQNVHSFRIVQMAIPKSVIALISALAWYNLTTQNPDQVYIAIPQSEKPPKLEWPPISVHYFSARIYQAGIRRIQIDGHDIQIYDREKSICDMFRFRKQLGEDIALEALTRYLNSEKRDLNKLSEMMEISRVSTVMKPYVKAIIV